ncbi:MAG: phage neck terminator protein [Plesiomonas sp.]
MTNEELFKILRPIVMTVTGVPECILADQNTKAPNGPYATIRPRQSVTERGQANIYDKNVPGDKVSVDVRSQIVATCSVQFYRGEARMFAERLKQCNKRPDVSALLWKGRVGWGGTDPVNDLTALQSANWEQRAQINIRLWYETSNIAEVNNILHASLEMQDEKGRVLVTHNI